MGVADVVVLVLVVLITVFTNGSQTVEEGCEIEIRNRTYYTIQKNFFGMKRRVTHNNHHFPYS